MSDTMKALDEIEAALKPFASVLRNNGELYEPDWITRDDCKSAARALSLLPTLRAALTPPADDHPLSGVTHEMWSEMVRTSNEPPADDEVGAMHKQSRPFSDPEKLQPKPRGQVGMEPLWKMYEPMATAALSALEAAGVRLVPVEATGDMLMAGIESDAVQHPWQALDVYRRMLAASPYAPQKDESHE